MEIVASLSGEIKAKCFACIFTLLSLPFCICNAMVMSSICDSILLFQFFERIENTDIQFICIVNADGQASRLFGVVGDFLLCYLSFLKVKGFLSFPK